MPRFTVVATIALDFDSEDGLVGTEAQARDEMLDYLATAPVGEFDIEVNPPHHECVDRDIDLAEAVAQALEDRGATAAAVLLRESDPDTDLWRNCLGPMLDQLEADYTQMAEETAGTQDATDELLVACPRTAAIMDAKTVAALGTIRSALIHHQHGDGQSPKREQIDPPSAAGALAVLDEIVEPQAVRLAELAADGCDDSRAQLARVNDAWRVIADLVKQDDPR